MRAQIKVRNLVNGQVNEQGSEEHFFYQEGQHRVVSNGQRLKSDDSGKFQLPEEVKVTKTKHGKRWSTSSMEVELAKDILEVRDGLGKVIDARMFKQKI